MSAASVLETCPACGRVLYFSHGETNLFHCQCGGALLRRDGIIEAKPFYTIAQPTDFIQPGTEGLWNGKFFKVLGRVRAWFEECVFNYWTIAWEDGGLAYLGEGYGLFAIYEKTTVDENVNPTLLDGLQVGKRVKLFANASFVLERKYTAYKWELEGEAWLPQAPATFGTFEAAAENGKRIEIFEAGRNLLRSFQVHYVSLESLQLTNTRMAAPGTRPAVCKKCGKENELKGFPFCHSYACVHCGTRHAMERGGDFKQSGQTNSTDAGPGIALGSKGQIKGIAYEVIGYAQKQERSKYRSQWKEYTLYNPQQGFAFLSEYAGHWIYVKERGHAPVLDKDGVTSFTFDEERFELYNRYYFDVVNAAGEFPYNVFNDGDKQATEFISPPEVWIKEKSGGEGIVWFLGEHIDDADLVNALDKPVALPYKSGVGAVDPKGYVGFDKIAKTGLAGILFLLFVHLLTSLSHLNRKVSEGTYSFGNSDTLTRVVNGIELEKGSSNLRFDIWANVDNGWCEVGGTLVNANTGTEYSFEQGVEYYHGYEGGENWSEGGTKESAYLNSIPAGRYNLIVRGLRENKSVYPLTTGAQTYSAGLPSFDLHVTYDVSNDRNFFLCLIPVLLWSIVHGLMVRHNERQRWYNSPFTPYTYEK